jgi:hypothetical protein
MADTQLPENRRTGFPPSLDINIYQVSLPIPTKDDYRVRSVILESNDEKTKTAKRVESLLINLPMFTKDDAKQNDGKQTEFNVREAEVFNDGKGKICKGLVISAHNPHTPNGAVFEYLVPYVNVNGSDTTLEKITILDNNGNKTDIQIAQRNEDGTYKNKPRDFGKIKEEFDDAMKANGKATYKDSDKGTITPKDVEDRSKALLEQWYKDHPDVPRPAAPQVAAINPMDLPRATGANRSSYLA